MLLTAKKKMIQRIIETANVMNSTGDHCEKTLNPCITFILLDTPATISPAAKVKLKRKAVIIYFITLFVSLKSPLLIINPIINSKTPTPILIHAARS